MPRFQHLVITRFSIRPTMTSTDRNELRRTLEPLLGSFDPLTPRSLDHRFRVFEVACLPGVLAQTLQEFTWVIAVDRDLPAQYRERLARLVSERPRTVIHSYDPLEPLGDVDWLRPYVEQPAPDYLLTTTLDDDDALPPRFAESIQQLVTERGDQLAPVETFGATDLWEWDLEVTDDAPLGYRAPWHRDAIPVVSVGFSLLARYPTYELTVMRLPHNEAQHVLDWDTPPRDPRIEEIRSVMQAGAARDGDSLRDFAASETFHDWVPLAGMPTMTNHQINVEGTRLHEAKERTAVTGAESFPNAAIDWDALDRHAPHFQTNRRMRARYFLARADRLRQRVMARFHSARQRPAGS